MRRQALAISLACGLLSGCGTTASVVDGSGFEMLHPLPITRNFIVKNDRRFAEEVATHNDVCAAQPGCRK